MRRRAGHWLLTYVCLALVWGSSFAFISLALESFTPVGVSVGRMLLGSATLLAICAATRTPLPPRWLWPRLAVTAVLATVLPWTLTAWGQLYISSALAAIIGSSVPLVTLLIVLLFFREEVPTPQRIAGLVIGFLGILIVVGVWRGMGAATWIGVGAVFAANVAFAFSLPYTRRHLTGGDRAANLPPMSLAAGMFLFAALETLPLGLVVDFVRPTVSISALLGLVALGCLGSGVAYILNYRLIGLTDTTTASTVMYVMPVVAVVIGTSFLGEHVTWNQPVGGAVILLGAALAQGLLRVGRPS